MMHIVYRENVWQYDIFLYRPHLIITLFHLVKRSWFIAYLHVWESGRIKWLRRCGQGVTAVIQYSVIHTVSPSLALSLSRLLTISLPHPNFSEMNKAVPRKTFGHLNPFSQGLLLLLPRFCTTNHFLCFY